MQTSSNLRCALGGGLHEKDSFVAGIGCMGVVAKARRCVSSAKGCGLDGELHCRAFIAWLALTGDLDCMVSSSIGFAFDACFCYSCSSHWGAWLYCLLVGCLLCLDDVQTSVAFGNRFRLREIFHHYICMH